MGKNKPAKHILVIRLSAMGDVAMTVPVFTSLIRTYPDIKLTLLTRGFFVPIFASVTGLEVVEADVKGKHKGVWGLYQLFRELRTLEIDAVADLHNVLRSNILKRYFKTSGIPFVQIDKGRSDKKALTASKNKQFRPLKTTHQRYADVFARMGYPVDLSTTEFLDKEPLTDIIYDLVGPDTKKWIGIAPLAAFPGKTYPLGLMKSVIGRLNSWGDCKIILFGGRNDGKILDGLIQNCENAVNLSGKLSFSDELKLISNLDLMVSMDSGNAHLAANYGIPAITLWGVTHPYAGFYPFGQPEENALLSDREKFPLIPTSVYGNKHPKGYEKAMETILPESVVSKIREILKTR